MVFQNNLVKTNFQNRITHRGVGISIDARYRISGSSVTLKKTHPKKSLGRSSFPQLLEIEPFELKTRVDRDKRTTRISKKATKEIRRPSPELREVESLKSRTHRGKDKRGRWTLFEFPKATREIKPSTLWVENKNKEVLIAPSIQAPETPLYYVTQMADVPLLVDTIIGTEAQKIKINGFEYEKMDALRKLMNLKVLLKREDILTARIRMLEKAITKEDWKKVKELLETLNLPRDIELFLLTAITYKLTNGKPQRKIRKIADTLYPPKDKHLFELTMRMFAQQYIKEYIKRIPLKDRIFLKESLNIKERIMGLVWSSDSKKGLQEESSSKEDQTSSEK